jgi:hypothetical protein
MSHPTYETLLKYIDKQLPETETTLIETHISGPCKVCLNKVNQIRMVVNTATHDQTIAPPSNVLSQAVALFRQKPNAPTRPRLRVLAKLLFDNHIQMPQLAMRGADPLLTHQLLFSAQQVDIDLQITPEHGDHNLVGQILGSEQTSEPSIAFVYLKSETGEMLKGTETDSLGQFSFRQIPSGVYDLVFDLENQEVAITSLEFSND